MKRGVTLISIIIYLILFTTFTVFAMSVNSNMNRNVFMDKGSIEVENEYSKLYTNMFTSAKNSTSYYTSSKETVTVINFSNGDYYIFDTTNNCVYKNDGILCNNLITFELSEVHNISTTTLAENVLIESHSLCVEVSFKKYDQILDRAIVVTVGDN